MNDAPKILQGTTDLEKGAYLTAIASLATADHQASEEEIEYLTALCQAADLTPEQEQHVLNAANEISGDELKQSLDVLKASELRFSLVADLMAFAKADQNYSEAEQQNVQQIAQYLGLNEQQYSTLNQFVEKAETAESPEQIQQQGLFGMKDQLQAAGIGGGGFLKGLISFAAPMILGGLLSRGLGSRRTGTGGGLGGMLEGGLGGMLGGKGLGGMLGGGGFGSLIGMLAGGRGLGSTGGLLGRVLGGRF